MRWSLVVGVVALASGCPSGGPPQPEAPVWSKVPCGHCSMVVSEPHPAAQAVLADGVRKHFDDVGCLAAFLEREAAPPKAAWVNDGQGGWQPVSTARFEGGHPTPMASGYLATPQGGLSFEQVRAELRQRRPGVAP